MLVSEARQHKQLSPHLKSAFTDENTRQMQQHVLGFSWSMFISCRVCLLQLRCCFFSSLFSCVSSSVLTLSFCSTRLISARPFFKQSCSFFLRQQHLSFSLNYPATVTAGRLHNRKGHFGFHRDQERDRGVTGGTSCSPLSTSLTGGVVS